MLLDWACRIVELGEKRMPAVDTLKWVDSWQP